MQLIDYIKLNKQKQIYLIKLIKNFGNYIKD